MSVNSVIWGSCEQRRSGRPRRGRSRAPSPKTSPLLPVPNPVSSRNHDTHSGKMVIKTSVGSEHETHFLPLRQLPGGDQEGPEVGAWILILAGKDEPGRPGPGGRLWVPSQRRTWACPGPATRNCVRAVWGVSLCLARLGPAPRASAVPATRGQELGEALTVQEPRRAAAEGGRTAGQPSGAQPRAQHCLPPLRSPQPQPRLPWAPLDPPVPLTGGPSPGAGHLGVPEQQGADGWRGQNIPLPLRWRYLLRCAIRPGHCRPCPAPHSGLLPKSGRLSERSPKPAFVRTALLRPSTHCVVADSSTLWKWGDQPCGFRGRPSRSAASGNLTGGLPGLGPGASASSVPASSGPLSGPVSRPP